MDLSPLRCLGVEAAATAVVGVLAALLVPAAAASGGPYEFDALLVRACSAVGLVGVAWLWVVTTLVVVEALGADRDRPAPGRVLAPTFVRRAVLAACGAGLAAGLAGPVHAASGGQHREALDARDSLSVLTGLPYPDRPVGRVRAGVGGQRADRHAEQVVPVRPGDSLWAIAARELGPTATDAEVDARWREIYAANRAAVGADPDLIRPAMRLRIPDDRAKETP